MAKTPAQREAERRRRAAARAPEQPAPAPAPARRRRRTEAEMRRAAVEAAAADVARARAQLAAVERRRDLGARVLHDVDGLTWAEVAALVGMSRQALVKRLGVVESARASVAPGGQPRHADAPGHG